MTNPIWEEIPDFPGFFVSNQGEVKGPKGLCRQRLECGYRRVKINCKQKYVHLLVAAAFLGPRPAGMVTRHIDGDYTNNADHNLVYTNQRGAYSVINWLRHVGRDEL